MLDIVIERVTVADTVDGRPGSRLDAFYPSRIGRAKAATPCIGKGELPACAASWEW